MLVNKYMSLYGEACTEVYPKVCEPATVTEKGKKYSSLQVHAIGLLSCKSFW